MGYAVRGARFAERVTRYAVRGMRIRNYGFMFQVSAEPLVAETASLIGKETMADEAMMISKASAFVMPDLISLPRNPYCAIHEEKEKEAAQ